MADGDHDIRFHDLAVAEVLRSLLTGEVELGSRFFGPLPMLKVIMLK